MPSFTPDRRIVECLMRDLQSADPDIRETALDRFGSLSGDHTEVIARKLVDPDPEVRGSAAANLGGVRRADAWPHLVRAAREEPSDEVRRHIVRALDKYRETAILDVLLELLAQPERDYRVRMGVVMQLWKYDPSVVVHNLQAVAMSDDHPLVRLHAVDSLELIDELLPFEPSRHELWLRLSEDDNAGISVIATAALGHTARALSVDLLGLLSRRLNGSDPDERSITLGRLCMLASDAAMVLVRPLLEDSDPSVRAGSCSCLGAIRNQAAVPLLLAVLRSDPELRVQTAALIGLGNYHTGEIGETLLDMIEAERLVGEPRSFLCGQLWKYPSARTVPLLQRVLDSPSGVPRRDHVAGALAFLQRLASSEP